MKKNALIIFAGLGVLVITSSIYWISQSKPTITHYENGSDFPFDRLPPSARDVRYYPSEVFSPILPSYEFKCSEADYRAWVDQNRKENSRLSEIKKIEEGGMEPVISKNGDFQLMPIKSYLTSSWQFEDQGIRLVYDLEEGRAIRWANSR